MTLLSVTNLTVSYGGIGAVHDTSLTLGAGEIVTVIGPNGAGKTTLLNAVMGVRPPNLRASGTVRLANHDITRLSIEDRFHAGMGLVPEQRALFPSMTVEDNLRLGFFRHRRQGRGPARAALEDTYALFPRLRERRLQHAATLSGGERQMLAMGRALMGRPTLLMLDEPSLGLAPLIVRDIFAIITSLKAAGTAILLVEQNARAALRIADRAYVLETGRITLEGSAPALAADPRITQTYLGNTAST